MSDHFLFISHAEKDEEVISHFVNLLYQIGLKKENMFCTSVPELGIPIKEDIYDYLRSQLGAENVIPIFMLSENYYESAACLNEMGAVWVMQKDYFTFLLPGFEFKQIRGAVNPNKRAIKLDNLSNKLRGDLSNFKNQICDIFGLATPDENYWERVRDEFITTVQALTPHIEIDINICNGYCINEVNFGGCDIHVDEIRNKVMAEIDFSKTKAEICSLVFFTGGINICRQFSNNKKLRFYMKKKGSISSLSVEMHLNEAVVEEQITLGEEWEEYAIPLKNFRAQKSEWTNLKEISFAVYRNVGSGSIEVKDIRID